MGELDGADEKPLRLDQDVREALLRANEGFTDSTYYSDKNFREQRNYEITDGALHVRSRTKTSWADSRNETEFVADDKATHRFLRERIDVLDTEGVRQEAAVIKAARKAAERAEREARPNDSADVALDADSGNAELTDPDLGDEDASVGGVPSNAKWFVAGALAIGGTVWVAPHTKRWWQTKGKPRLDEWRARRRDSGLTSADQPGEVREANQWSNGDADE